MRTVSAIRERCAYTRALRTKSHGMVVDVCTDALEVGRLVQLLIDENMQSAADAGLALKLSDDDAVYCYVHARAMHVMKDHGGVGLLFSKERRYLRWQLALILQNCFSGLSARFGARVGRLLETFDETARGLRREYELGFAHMSFADGTGVRWHPIDLEEKIAVWEDDLCLLDERYERGEIDEDEYIDETARLGARPKA